MRSKEPALSEVEGAGCDAPNIPARKIDLPAAESLPTPDTVERRFSAASQLQNNRGFSPRGKASYQGMASAAMPQPPAKMRLQALARVGRTLLSAACPPRRSKHPVILSVAVPSRSEGIAESKDPCTLNSAGSSTTFSSHPIPPKPALVADPLFLIFFPTRDFVCRKGSPNLERACHQPIPHRNRSSTLKSPGVGGWPTLPSVLISYPNNNLGCPVLRVLCEGRE